MIYLIGGPPKCGKSTLARLISKETGASWISADTLQNIVKVYIPKADQPKLFPSSNHRTSSNDERFAKYDSKTLIQDYCAQAKTLYPALEMIIETYLNDEYNFIIEGYQVTPELVDKVSKKYGSEYIGSVFLLKKDPEQFVRDIYKATTPNNWIIRRTKNKATFTKISQMIVDYSKLVEVEAIKYKLPVLVLDKNFEVQLSELVQQVKKVFDKSYRSG